MRNATGKGHQMANKAQLHRPWLVAVWPGMGHVAVNAGVYLLAKLGMSVIAEFQVGELFDVDYVEVKEGIIQTGKRPGVAQPGDSDATTGKGDGDKRLEVVE